MVFDAIFTGLYRPFFKQIFSTRRHSWDGTTTAAKKGGDNIGFSGHKENERR